MEGVVIRQETRLFFLIEKVKNIVEGNEVTGWHTEI